MGYWPEARAAYGYDLGDCGWFAHEEWFSHDDRGESIFARLRALGADVSGLGYVTYGNALGGGEGCILCGSVAIADLQGKPEWIDVNAAQDEQLKARLREAVTALGLPQEEIGKGPQWMVAVWYG